ncbi:MAG TPA: hypothetical protein VNE71_02520 [Myxococcota bacterium]|nr:hypothetical protein [Myxococcota bacterium]
MVPRHTAAEAVTASGLDATEVEVNDGVELRQSNPYEGAGPIWIVRRVTSNGCLTVVFVDDATLAVLDSSTGGRGRCRAPSYIDVQKLIKEP